MEEKLLDVSRLKRYRVFLRSTGKQFCSYLNNGRGTASGQIMRNKPHHRPLGQQAAELLCGIPCDDNRAIANLITKCCHRHILRIADRNNTRVSNTKQLTVHLISPGIKGSEQPLILPYSPPIESTLRQCLKCRDRNQWNSRRIRETLGYAESDTKTGERPRPNGDCYAVKRADGNVCPSQDVLDKCQELFRMNILFLERCFSYNAAIAPNCCSTNCGCRFYAKDSHAGTRAASSTSISRSVSVLPYLIFTIRYRVGRMVNAFSAHSMRQMH